MTCNDPLLLIPGMMCDARLFAPQIAALSASRTISVPVMRGATVQEIATNILANASPVFAVAGLSMGGIVAMEIMAQAPQRISRVALLDTNPLAETEEVAARRGPQIEAAQNGDMIAIMAAQMFPYYLADTTDQAHLIAQCHDMAKALGPDAFVAQSMALRSRPDQQDTLRNVTVPALVLCGEHDKLCPIHRHTLMAELMPHATLEIIPNAGHIPTLEQPNLTNEALRKWLT